MAVDQSSSGGTDPGPLPRADPVDRSLQERRLRKVSDRSQQEDAEPADDGSGGGGGGGDVTINARVSKLEGGLAKVEGSLEWAGRSFVLMASMMLAGFSLLVFLVLNVGSKVEGISSKLADEFRAQRQEQSSQITAISNAITATRQQPPQVLLVPAPKPFDQDLQKK